MPSSHLKERIIRYLVILLAFSGWITAGVTYKAIAEHQDFMTDAKLWNATHILEDAFQHTSNREDALNLVNEWIKKGWTAQTGSLVTICESSPETFISMSPEFDELLVKDTCKKLTSHFPS